MNALCLSRNKVLNSAESLENMFSYQKFIEAGKNTIKENGAYTSDQKLHAHCSKAVHETTRHNLTSGGKLERIAEQDKIFLNTSIKSLLIHARPVWKDAMVYSVYRKMNAESEEENHVEENEHKVDNNEDNNDILQSGEKDNLVLSRSTKKKHRKRLNNLVRQLDTFNLEENNKKPVCQNNRKLCQKMKKNKEGKIDSSILMNCLMNGVIDKTYQMSPPCDTNSQCYKLHKNNITRDQMNYKLQTLLSLKERRAFIEGHTYASGRCGKHCETDSIGYMVEPHTELRNGIESNEIEKRDEDWILFNFQNKMSKITKELDKSLKDLDYYTKKIGSKQGISKPKNVEHIDKKRDYRLYRLENRKVERIEKLKNAHRLKRIQKAAEKMKGEALVHELNSVIKNMRTFGITEEVNANTIKSKCTQTHRTPV